MPGRRIVTGHDAAGRSVFVSDSTVEPVTPALLPGSGFHQIWSRDATATIPSDVGAADGARYFPGVDGFRFLFFTLGPDSVTLPEDLDIRAALDELDQRLPGLADPLEPDHPGMHTTDTVDFDVVISGEVCLELDDGAEVRLGPGDCVVQNGTRHAWRNRSAAPCTLAVALIGARRDAPAP